MRIELEKLLEGYKKFILSFEEDNAEALKYYNDGNMYMCDLIDADDAFEMGEKYGSYTEALEIIDSLGRILDIKDTK